MRYEGDPYYDDMFHRREGFTARVDHTNRTTGVTEDRTDIVKSFKVTRELSGDLPEQASLVGGAVAVAASVEADAAMSNAPHPLKAADRAAWIAAGMKLWAGFDLDALEVFTGRVREFGFDESAWGLTLDLIDGRDDLRAPVTLPAYGSVTTRVAPGRGQRYPTNASAVIVAALHRNGIRVTPEPAASSCVLSVPLAYGALADKGWTVPLGAGVDPSVPWLQPGKFGPLPNAPTGYGFWWLKAYPNDHIRWVGATSSLRFEFFVNTAGLSGSLEPVTMVFGGNLQARITVTATTISCRVWDGSTWTNGPTTTVAAGWHHVSMDVFVGGSCGLWVDGTRTAFTAPPLGGQSTAGANHLEVNSLGRIQQLSMHASGGGRTWTQTPTYDPSFTPQADIDTALLEVDYLPPIDGRDAWELCKDIATAELGMVGFDEGGRFFFKNRDTINAPVTPVATWDTDLVDNITGSAAADSVRTRVSASVEPKVFIDSGRGAETELSTAVPVALADDVFTLPTGTSTFIISASAPWYPVSARVEVITALGRAWDVDNGMVVCTTESGSTLHTSGQIDASIIPLSPTSAKLVVTNYTGSTKYVVWPTAWTPPTYDPTPFDLDGGGPAMWVNGRGLTGDYKPVTVDVSDPAAITAWGDRALVLEANDWRQQPASVSALATKLVADLKEPRVELGDITVPADVRWQLADPILLHDWQGRLPDVLARITRAELTVSHEVESGIIGRYSLRTIPT